MRRCFSRQLSQMEYGFTATRGRKREKRELQRGRDALAHRRGGGKRRYPSVHDRRRRDADPFGLVPASVPRESNWRRGSRFPGNVPPPPGSPTEPADNRSVAPSLQEAAAHIATESCWPIHGCESKEGSETGNY